VNTILEKNLDGKPAAFRDEQPALAVHKNVRGPAYYREGEGSRC
jgi:hypothetical protein